MNGGWARFSVIRGGGEEEEGAVVVGCTLGVVIIIFIKHQ